MNYSKFYDQNASKQVKVIMTDGEEFSGELFAYISAEDNEPDTESIIVGRTELFTREIYKIIVV